MQRTDFIKLEVKREVSIFHGYDNHGIFSDGLANVKKNGKWGYINERGEITIPIIYDEVDNFSDDLAMVKKDNKKHFINKNGKTIFWVNECYDYVGSFHNFLACVRKSVGPRIMYGYIDTMGREVVPCIYEYVRDFSDGMGCVRLNGKYGFVNIKGQLIIPCIYNDASCFANGLARVKNDSCRYGYINRKGKEVISCQYSYATDFTDSLACVNMGKKYGYINTCGEVIVPSIYDVRGSFSEGMIPVKSENKWGFVDVSGNLIVPNIYDYVENFNEGLARVNLNNKFGFINKKGFVIIPIIFDNCSSKFENGFIYAIRNGEIDLINQKDECIDRENVYPHNFKHMIEDVIYVNNIDDIPNDVVMITNCLKYEAVFELGDKVVIVEDGNYNVYRNKVNDIESIVSDNMFNGIKEFDHSKRMIKKL